MTRSSEDPKGGLDASDRDVGLERKAVVGFSWTMVGLLIAEPLRLLTTVVLARILSPREFGIVAMAAVFVGLMAFANDLGFSVALVQRDSLDQRHATSAFWASLVVGAVLTLASWAAAPLVASVYGQPDVIAVVRGLSLSFVLTSFFLVQNALVRRRMDFKTPAIASVLAMGANAAVAISSAVAGLGFMSIVYGNLAALLASGVVVQWVARFVPRGRLSWSAVRETVGVGIAVTAGDLASYGMGNVDNLMVGRVLGAATLGEYGVAYNLVTYPVRRVAKMAAAVTLPAFSMIKTDAVRFRRAYLRALGLALVVLWPFLACAMVVAEPLVIGLYGAKWSGAVAPFRMLCAASMLLVLVVFAELALKSLGMQAMYAGTATAGFILFVASVTLMVHRGTVAVALAVTVAIAVYACVVAVVVVRSLAIPTGEAAHAVAGPIVMAMASAVLAYAASYALDAASMPRLIVATIAILGGIGGVWMVARQVPFFPATRAAESMVSSVIRRRRGVDSHD